MTLLAEIASSQWQLAVGGSGLRDDVVQDEADAEQQIILVLHTPRGSDPLRPEFGCDIDRYVDRPINLAAPYLVREAVDALRKWVTRIEVLAVTPAVSESGLVLRVRWRMAGSDGSGRETEVRPDAATGSEAAV
jgi:phage baseplate assembly protein W